MNICKENVYVTNIGVFLNISVTVLCNGCHIATQPYFMEVTSCHM